MIFSRIDGCIGYALFRFETEGGALDMLAVGVLMA